MNTSQKTPRKRSGLLVLAGIFLLIGGGVIYIGSHNFPIRVVGIAFVIASAYLIQVSNARNRSKVPEASGEVNNRNSTNASRRVLWIASVSLVPILAGAWYLLHLDAIKGGQAAWPADLFAGVGLVCAAVWSLLMVMILRGRGSHK
jgi:hypothetical protein